MANDLFVEQATRVLIDLWTEHPEFMEKFCKKRGLEELAHRVRLAAFNRKNELCEEVVREASRGAKSINEMVIEMLLKRSEK